ncbi:coproporphyrinogen III oxidase, partial [Rhizobium ruizarguesonis]
ARFPRYTSSPTAPALSTAVGLDESARGLANTGKAGTVSVYLHVPFCRSMCWYRGCHTNLTRQDGPVREYMAVMIKELEL